MAGAGLAMTDYPAASIAAAQSDGKLYAVPFDVHAVILYYNKDMLGAAGLLDENGLPKVTQDVPNMVVTAGKAFIASRMAGTAAAVMSHMAIGSSNTAESTGQTALVAQTAIVGLTSTTPSSNQVTFSATFGAGVGTGTIAEAGLFNAASAGTMLARSTAVSLTKGATDTLTITWIVTVN
jgi:hypothetical protein